MAKNFPLKFALLQQYGTQRAASEPLRILYDRLSRIVCGYVTPTAEELKRFEKVLGKEKMKEMFPKKEVQK